MIGDRIHNWSRALRAYPEMRHARSAEGQARSTRGNEAEYDNGLPPPADVFIVDVLDAWAVELAWRRCSPASRWVLKTHYHDKLAPVKACVIIQRRAGLVLRLREWRDYLRVAKHELACLLGENFAPGP